MNRLRELDFLRGIAILLVLLRHRHLSEFTSNMGWIGVDLFFVLSGFLVSGLLFREYSKFGDIQPKRFLIRRGFKIYPVYYLFYGLYLIPLFLNGNYNKIFILSELTFVQNYVHGFGYAFGAGWSLAIEEHFYFGLSLLLWLGIKNNKINFSSESGNNDKKISLQHIIPVILVLCLILRFITNLAYPLDYGRNFTMTHLRIDSLLTGVYISFMYYFKPRILAETYNKYKYVLYAIAFSGLAWTPFIDPIPSFFVKTAGFSLLYISFGILLLYILLTPEVNRKLNSVMSERVVNLISKIGYCSYSIYIIHTFVNMCVNKADKMYSLSLNGVADFIITSVISISIGMLMTYKVEAFFLTMRNKYFPARV